MILKSLALLTLTAIVSSTAHSQTPTEVRIDPQQPTVYFAAERLVGDKLWLRLHNNSHWAISFLTEHPAEITIPFRLADGREVKALIDGGKVWPEYEIVNLWNGGYAEYSCVISESWLAPGTSALMAVQAERLKPMAEFYLRFSYEWQGNRNEPEHRVRFSYRPEIKIPGAN